MLLGNGASTGRSIEAYRKRRFDRAIARLDAKEDEGRWITTENGHHVHLNEEGEIDKGNPKVVAYMEDDEVGSKKRLNKAFSDLADRDGVGRFDKAMDLLRRMRVGSKIQLPDSWRDDYGVVPVAMKVKSDYSEEEVWKVHGGKRGDRYEYEIDEAQLAANMIEKDENDRAKVISAARTEESRERGIKNRESRKTPIKHKHDGTVIGNHTSDYRNDYVTDAERDQVRKKFDDVNFWHGAEKSGKVLEDEIRYRAGLRKTREQDCDGQPQVEDVYDVLRDIRPFGLPEGSELVQVDYNGIDPERADAIIKEATDRFPTAWFEGIEKPVHIKIIDGYGRSHFTPDYWGAGIGGDITIYTKHDPKVIEGLNVDDNLSDVAITNSLAHELGHYIEDNNSSVRSMANEHLNDRTKDSPEEDLEPGYTTKPDSFFDPYMGKQYKQVYATEIISMLVQNLGVVNPFDKLQGKKMFMHSTRATDRRSLRFILGMLGGLS